MKEPDVREPELKSGREYNFTLSWLSVFQNAVDNFDEFNPDIGKKHPKAREVQINSLKYRVKKLEKEVNEYEQYHPLSASFNKLCNSFLAAVTLRSLDAYYEERILQAERSQSDVARGCELTREHNRF